MSESIARALRIANGFDDREPYARGGTPFGHNPGFAALPGSTPLAAAPGLRARLPGGVTPVLPLNLALGGVRHATRMRPHFDDGGDSGNGGDGTGGDASSGDATGGYGGGYGGFGFGGLGGGVGDTSSNASNWSGSSAPIGSGMAVDNTTTMGQAQGQVSSLSNGTYGSTNYGGTYGSSPGGVSADGSYSPGNIGPAGLAQGDGVGTSLGVGQTAALGFGNLGVNELGAGTGSSYGVDPYSISGAPNVGFGLSNPDDVYSSVMAGLGYSSQAPINSQTAFNPDGISGFASTTAAPAPSTLGDLSSLSNYTGTSAALSPRTAMFGDFSGAGPAGTTFSGQPFDGSAGYGTALPSSNTTLEAGMAGGVGFTNGDPTTGLGVLGGTLNNGVLTGGPVAGGTLGGLAGFDNFESALPNSWGSTAPGLSPSFVGSAGFSPTAANGYGLGAMGYGSFGTPSSSNLAENAFGPAGIGSGTAPALTVHGSLSNFGLGFGAFGEPDTALRGNIGSYAPGTIGTVSGDTTMSNPATGQIGFDNLGQYSSVIGSIVPGLGLRPAGWSPASELSNELQNPGDYYGENYPSLVGQHLTPAGIAGLLGNFSVESNGWGYHDPITGTQASIVPGAVGASGDLGIAQDLGARKTGLLAALGLSGLSSTAASPEMANTLSQQIGYNLADAFTHPGQYAATLSALTSPNVSPSGAATTVAENFEGPKSLQGAIGPAGQQTLSERAAAANQIAAALSIANAQSTTAGLSAAMASTIGLPGLDSGYGTPSVAPTPTTTYGADVRAAMAIATGQNGQQDDAVTGDEFSPGVTSGLDSQPDPAYSWAQANSTPAQDIAAADAADVAAAATPAVTAPAVTSPAAVEAPSAWTTAEEPGPDLKHALDAVSGATLGNVPGITPASLAESTMAKAMSPALAGDPITERLSVLGNLNNTTGTLNVSEPTRWDGTNFDGSPFDSPVSPSASVTTAPTAPSVAPTVTTALPAAAPAAATPAVTTTPSYLPGQKTALKTAINVGAAVANPVVGAVNAISGLLGGPTLGGLATDYSSPSSVEQAGGQGGNSHGVPSQAIGYAGSYATPGAGSSGSLTDAGTATAASSGSASSIAQQAYLAALAHMTSPPFARVAKPVPLIAPTATAAKVYDPMSDPAVLEALYSSYLERADVR